MKKSKEELLKEKAEVEKELVNVPLVTDLGAPDDIDAFDTEADEAEEKSKNLAVRAALKERLAEINSELAKLEGAQSNG